MFDWKRVGGRRAVTALACIALAASGGLVGSAGATAAVPSGETATTHHGHAIQVQPTHTGHGLATLPLMIAPRGTRADGTPILAESAPSGYLPGQIRSYLGLTGDGSGQTLAIVDAYDDPYIASDVDHFSQQAGLPGVCSTTKKRQNNCFVFEKAAPDGTSAIDPAWSLETSMDVEWAHAIAPNARILLVEAYDASLESLMSAIDYAARTGAAVISNSYGTTSEFSEQTYYDNHCVLDKSLCVFSSGDWGNPAGYPANSPDVLSVGGTSLDLNADGTVASETAWTFSGGGVSWYEPRPAYQDAVNAHSNRGVPDVSFDADPWTGVAVWDSVGYYGTPGGWYQVGGTSLSAPAWAAILAVGDQLRAAVHKKPLVEAGFDAQETLYSLTSGLADITEGANGVCDVCSAGPGYDFVTGLGSPRAGIDTALQQAP